jgi:poly(A) polymerase
MSQDFLRIVLPKDMKDKECQTLFVAFDHRLRYVGGAVRDLWLAQNHNNFQGENFQTDYDLATPMRPDQVQKIAQKLSWKCVPTGLEHGTVTVISPLGKVFQITSLRRDIETYGRKARVLFTDHWHEDAQRRDFTINALYADLKGRIFDPTGEGLQDLKNVKLRFIGNPYIRLHEDYLRILRFFRLSAQLSVRKLDKQGLEACLDMQKGLKNIAKERVSEEFLKCLLRSRDGFIFPHLKKLIVFKSIVSDFSASELESLFKLNDNKKIRNASELFFYLSGCPKKFKPSFERNIIFSKAFKKDFDWIASAYGAFQKNQGYRCIFYDFGPEAALSAARILRAQKKISPTYFQELQEFGNNYSRPVFPLTGQDLMKLGYKPGKDLGVVLRKLEQKWRKSYFRLRKIELLLNLERF